MGYCFCWRVHDDCIRGVARCAVGDVMMMEFYAWIYFLHPGTDRPVSSEVSGRHRILPRSECKILYVFSKLIKLEQKNNKIDILQLKDAFGMGLEIICKLISLFRVIVGIGELFIYLFMFICMYMLICYRDRNCDCLRDRLCCGSLDLDDRNLLLQKVRAQVIKFYFFYLFYLFLK
jgi:hypothetical protein